MHNKLLNKLILSIVICESTRKSTRKRIVVSANLELFSRDSGILTEIASTTKPFAGSRNQHRCARHNGRFGQYLLDRLSGHLRHLLPARGSVLADAEVG